MKTSKLLISLIAALPGAVTAAGHVAVDTSQWKCKQCNFPEGRTASVEVGVGTVSQDSAKFGRFNGLGEKGGFLIGGASVRNDGEDGAYWSLDAADLGLDTRSLSLVGGTQGRYRAWLRYDQLPNLSSDSARTPFLGSGTGTLTLPAGFPATSTAGMPLGTSLQAVDIGTRRKRFEVGAALLSSPRWEYAVNVRRETKDGTMRSSGAFFVNAAQLIEPVDTTTDQVDATASYTGQRWQFKLGYYASLFRNANSSLTWSDPFTPVVAGAGIGQLGLAPDNDFHQLSAAAGYQVSARTRLSADVAVGRMTQNDSFLAATQNAGLVVGALPGSSLNGRVATLDAALRFTSQLSDAFRLNAAYTHNDRDNTTPILTYASVATDMFVGAPRSNTPYSFTQDKLKLRGDYRISDENRVALGYDRDENRRTFQSVDRTTDDTVWARLSSRAFEDVELSFKAAHGERSNSGYAAVAGLIPPENPLMRKYHLADRKRDTASARADITVSEEVRLGVGVDASRDDYNASSIGLTSGRELMLSGDLSWAMSDETRFTFFVNRQQIRSEQSGSSTFSTPDWSASNRDTVDFVGIGVKHIAIPDKLDIGADLGFARSKGEIGVFTGVGGPAFPKLSTSLDSLRVYATYRLKDNITLQGSFWHERYDSRNWQLDGVMPATIENVLTLGETAPSYRVNVFRVSMRYKF